MNLESTYSRNVPKQDSYNSEFENRQKEYNSLFERLVPKEIDFSEKLNDEAITNMNELIERAKREREQEMVTIAIVYRLSLLSIMHIIDAKQAINSRSSLCLEQLINKRFS